MDDAGARLQLILTTMRKIGILRFILAIMLVATLPMTVLAGPSKPEAPPVAGGYSTVVVARLFSDSTDVTDNVEYEVTALMDGEQRAVGSILNLSDGNVVLVFRVWGDTGMGSIDETGKPITFLMHDSSSGLDYDVTPDEPITFRGDYTYGMPSQPVALRFSFGQHIPIESLGVTKNHIFVYQDEGDIRERLDALVTVLPPESKQTFHWEVERVTVPEMLTFDEETGYIDANCEGTATVVAVADADPTIRSTAVTVTVINPARTLIAGELSYIVYMTSRDPIDVSDDMNSLIIIGPHGYSSINVSYTSSDPAVVSTRRDESSGQQLFVAQKPGSSVVTAALTYFDCYTEADTTITLDINVYVSLPLTGITVDVNHIQVSRDSVATLTLRAQPEGAVLTSDNINLTIADTRIAQLGDFYMEDGVSMVEVPIEGLFPGTTSVSNALQPEAEAQAIGNIDVVVPLQLVKGWQWVTSYVPTAISGEALETAFGDRLTEVRSWTKTLFNDPDYGYIGSLYESGLGQDECYKINMAADASHVFERPEGPVAPYAGGTVNISGRWSWMANPYYCSHPIADYVSGASDEDMIVSQDAFAIYTDGEWIGSLKALRHGEGYMYFAENGFATLKLKAEGYVSDIEEEGEEEEMYEEEEENEVKAFRPVNARRYMNNMCMIASLDENLTAQGNCRISAFVGDECRGTARQIGNLFFLTVHGDAGEMVSLRLTDEDAATTYEIQGSTELQPVVGSVKHPLLIRKANKDQLTIDPLPSAEDSYYTLQGIRLRQAPRKGIYIHNGRKVAVK